MKLEAYRAMQELEESHWWYRARADIICSILTRYVARGGSVVDFGCGTGRIAKRLRGLGYQVIAADNSEYALSACRRAGLRTVNVDHDQLASGSTDCVLLGDVLEHVEDDVGLLMRLRDALRPGGHLVATVPAYEFLWSGEDYVSNHVRRYKRSALLERVCAAGYELIWSSYFNTILFPAVSAAVIAKRLFRPRTMYQSDIAPLPNWQNKILYELFAIERHWLNLLRFPVGASLFVVARVSTGQAEKVAVRAAGHDGHDLEAP